MIYGRYEKELFFFHEKPNEEGKMENCVGILNLIDQKVEEEWAKAASEGKERPKHKNYRSIVISEPTKDDCPEC